MATVKKEEPQTGSKATTQGTLENLSIRVARSTVAVIDTMVQRGAIKGEELTVMGTLRDQAVQLSKLIESMEAEKS